MMDLTGYMDGLIAKARQTIPQAPEDYTDEDGLLVCGKCHTHKTMRLDILGEERVVPVLCRCGAEARHAEETARKERDRQTRIADRRAACFGQGDRKADMTFASDDGQDAQTLEIARGYVEMFPQMQERGKGLLLLGPAGTGKTFAACCIANALLGRGYRVLVTTFAEVAARLQGTYEQDEVYADLQSYDLLVLDDLGAERDTSYMDEIVFTVIDARCSARKPMIVTSNIDAKEFGNGKGMADRRVYSRLYETCIPVSVTGRDRRREKMLNETANDISALISAGRQG